MNKRIIVLSILLVAVLASSGVAGAEEIFVVPGGQSIGVAVVTEGLVVIGNSDLGNIPSPARLSGLRAGDRLLSVNGESLTSAEHLLYLIDGKDSVELLIERDGKRFSREIRPVHDPRDGMSRLGVWVRDSAAGIGTLSFYDPETMKYASLGHAITDIDTGNILSVEDGLLFDAAVVDINRSESGSPGELIGQFSLKDAPVGTIRENNSFGVFGELYAKPYESAYSGAVPIAEPASVKNGKAILLTTLTDGEVHAYDCEITRCARQDSPAMRSMSIRITDEELIRQTGGIAQGMSGSPILQDGKLVGVVTHVYVGDPQQGYAVYAKWMYDEMAA